jgi:tripartite-type tricarboxylate transporter receptor subunit TctC
MAMLKRCSEAGLLVLLISSSCGTLAQAYPSKPIKIIAPFSPGASTDIVGRLLAAKLSESWGQTVFVENRAGAGGTIGATFAARSPPDGYTLLMGSVGSIGTAGGLYKNLPYDPIKDFAPITLGVRAASVLAVHPSLPVHSVKELVAFAKARAHQLNYSSSGSGSPGHLAMELFNTMAGVKTTHIAYRGPAEALNDLIAGQVQLSIQSVVSALPFVNSGKLRALATSGRERLRELSHLPTISEAGLNGYEVYVWYGVLAPAGTPPEIISKLNHELVRIFNLPDIKTKLLAQGGDLATGTPDEFARFIRADVDKWNKVIKLSGARPD